MGRKKIKQDEETISINLSLSESLYYDAVELAGKIAKEKKDKNYNVHALIRESLENFMSV